MLTVKLSNIKPQSIYKTSELIQVVNFIYTKQPSNDTSQNAKREIKKDKNKQITVIKEEPFDPKYLPNNPARQEPVIDKNTSNKYIFRKDRIRTYGINIFLYKDLADLRYKPLSHFPVLSFI